MAKTIGTHSGTFHADESLAVALLRSLPEWKDAKLIRTRDPAKLADCDIVVDVGGEYEDARKRYDHHQRGFTEVFGHGFKTKLSSAGLVYKHFGRQIIAQHLGLQSDDARLPTLYLKVYEEFVEALDGIDNGIAQWEASFPDVKVKTHSVYKSKTDLSSRVAKLNPAWNEPATDDVLDAQFLKASAMAGTEFFEALQYTYKAWLPARDIVLQALQARPAGFNERVVVFDRFAPWKDHLFGLEKELGAPPALYILYPEDASSKWRIQAVPVAPDSFESRKALPEPWRGLRDAELSSVTGVEGCIFVHASGFIGGCHSQEGVLELARLALHS